ncbi:MAG: M23 family metallopeptidase [Epulopiscium sp.]|mgnify:CR=1 FL=1|nr:M23 family metallopeptidase [Candidatus Epulonipiscium sp.]
MTPVHGVITDYFGIRNNPILKKEENHTGIDIAAPLGTPIVAVQKGKIKEVKTSATYGQVVIYDTIDGYTVFYAHCQSILVKPLDEIEQGQIIATVGDTGLTTGPHLHYELSKDGILIDPINYVHLPSTHNLE